MKVLEIILPVLVMILLGMACKRLKLLDQNGINNMKLLVTQIMLPVAIFHALATAEYNKETGILVGIMFVMLVVSFSIGFLLRPLMPAERYRKYLPFMVSVYEGGSMAYPLYTSLCGAENLSQIAVLDIAGLLFGFSVYMECSDRWKTGKRSIRENCFPVQYVHRRLLQVCWESLPDLPVWCRSFLPDRLQVPIQVWRTFSPLP